MNAFDLIVLVVLILFALRGAMKGMVSQIVSVGSYIICWIVASRFAFLIAPSIPAEEPWNKIGAMIVLFVLTMIAIRFCHSIVEKWIKSWHLSGVDKFLGGFLGFVKGVLVCMVLTFFGVMLSETTRQMIFESKSGNSLAQLIDKTGTFIPSDSCELLHAQIEKFNAHVNGTSVPQEKNSLNLSAATESGKTTSGQSSTGIGGLLSRSNALLNEAQSLRSDFNKETGGAVSLLDGISKWWNGESTSSKNTQNDKTINSTESSSSPTNGSVSKTSELGKALSSLSEELKPTTVKKMSAPVLQDESVPRLSLKSETPQVLPPPVLPKATFRDEATSSDQKSLTVTPNNMGQTAPPSTGYLSSLSNTPPISSANQEVPNSMDSASLNAPEAVQAMAIPQSASNFLPQPMSSDHPMRSPESLLDATQGVAASTEAKLFSSPRRRGPRSTTWDPKTWAGALNDSQNGSN